MLFSINYQPLAFVLTSDTLSDMHTVEFLVLLQQLQHGVQTWEQVNEHVKNYLHPFLNGL
jgi:hypothetical protein